jgi:MYXO-CTERM domain-containing protein
VARGVVLVQFLVDGTTVGQTAQSPYQLDFDSSVVSNAPHMFSAKAWDGAGNFALSAVVMATVTGNTPGIKPPPTTGTAGTGSGTGAGGAGGPGGSGVTTGKGGCGCAVAGGASAAWLILLAALAISRARRR